MVNDNAPFKLRTSNKNNRRKKRLNDKELERRKRSISFYDDIPNSPTPFKEKNIWGNR